MTLTVATNGKELTLSLSDPEQVHKALTWELTVAAASTLFRSEVNSDDGPFIEVSFDEHIERKAYFDYIGVRYHDAEFAVAHITVLGDDIQTTYYLSLFPNGDGGWKIGSKIIIDQFDNDGPSFGDRPLLDQLAFFFPG